MFLKYFNSFLLWFFVFYFNVQCQICTRRAVVTSTHLEPYLYTYRETYQAKCWFGRTCSKTRIKTDVAYRTGTRREVKNIQVCCDGYIRDDSQSEDSIACKPICMPSCNNGFCKSPGECACTDGYSVDPSNPHNCLPQCLSCEHGTCVKPNTCECNFGYILNGTCQPICTEACKNGLCSAPDTCECLNGFRKSEINTCDPYCSAGCLHGTCVEPEICLCDEGYILSNNECVPDCENGCDNGTCVSPNKCECNSGFALNGTCQPICAELCENGLCTAPDTCECLSGFRKSYNNNTCDPYCSTGCLYGTCVEPETCSCDEGYAMVNEECVPECKSGCDNGSCVAPETCECESGYTLENGTCLPVCPGGCLHGYCSAPLQCSCDPGYIFDGSYCKPVCEKDCGHGKCIAPDTCVCDSGYNLNPLSKPVCVPYCSIPCIHGSCVDPEFCLCDPGYSKDFIFKTCVPDCSYDCGNGTCSAPDTCECHPGYGQSEDYDMMIPIEPVCVPLCIGCEGTCIRPLTCICDEDFETKNETVNGEECDCFENCSVPLRQCARTVCFPKSTTDESSSESEGITILTKEKETENEKGARYFTYDNYYTDETNTEILVSESFSTTSTHSASSKIDTENTLFKSKATDSARQHKAVEKGTSTVWIIVTIAIIVLILIACGIIISILRRKKVFRFLSGGGSYVVEDTPQPTNSPSINLECIAVKKSA